MKRPWTGLERRAALEAIRAGEPTAVLAARFGRTSGALTGLAYGAGIRRPTSVVARRRAKAMRAMWPMGAYGLSASELAMFRGVHPLGLSPDEVAIWNAQVGADLRGAA